MAKLIDDPKVAALVEKHSAAAVKAKVKAVLAHLKDEFDTILPTLETDAKKTLRVFHANVKDRIKNDGAESAEGIH